ncbi:MAG TPA: phosphotransferase family protein [Rhizomicrobium sp.]|nr:phosphotransferase family protein [Rhizomicrobium sp.]
MKDRDARPAKAVEFDPMRLDNYLRSLISVPESVMHLQRVEGGQSNPTFFVNYGHLRLVLRKQPAGQLLPSAHAIDREFRIQKALAQTDVPVPEMMFYCEDREIIGTPFYVMKRVEGRVYPQCQLSDAPIRDRKPMYRAFAQTLGKLHNIAPASIGLADYGKPGDYYSRQVARWSKQWALSQTRDDSNVELLIDWLPGNIPPNQITTIAHGDYRIGNVIFDKLDVAAVLDWELSSLGHPLADLAHSCIAWQSRPEDYGGLKGCNLAELGIPEQKQYEEWYYEAAQHQLRMTSFHMVFALFRFAVIFEGIAARAKVGNAAGSDTSTAPRISRCLAQYAVDLLDRG